MQAKLKRGEAAFHSRSAGLSIVIFAGVPLIAALTLVAPDRALAACGGSSHPAGVHSAGSGSGGVHVATGIAAPSGGGGGGGSGSLGCAGGSSASALRGLPTASSGRVVETGAHAARTENHARTATTRTATTRTANAAAHMHGVGHAHRI
jgi:hypothetical protein